MFGDIVSRLLAGEQPTKLDRLRISLMMNGVFAQFQVGYEAVRANPKALKSWWTNREDALGGWLQAPVFRLWWKEDRYLFSEGFRAIVDGKVAELDAAEQAAAPPQ